jgi:hypothetical protein
LAILLLGLTLGPGANAQVHPAESVMDRFAPPAGYERLKAHPKSYAHFLRNLPLLPGRPQVLLYNGKAKSNQQAHLAVVDLDVGSKDLQQCADAVMRIVAEYLRQSGNGDALCFRYTSGHAASWQKWQAGESLVGRGNKVLVKKGAPRSSSAASFSSYLEKVFTYAGTASLSKELAPISNPARIEPGDSFIQGGHPGHAVLVVDVAENTRGRRVFLLGQSYMPAQQFHILKGPPGEALGAWYAADALDPLVTPEWTFKAKNLMRLNACGCGEGPPLKSREILDAKALCAPP